MDSYNLKSANCGYGNKYHSTITFPKWFGWDKLDPAYDAVVTVPGGVKNVIIDPSGRLADINTDEQQPETQTRIQVRFAYLSLSQLAEIPRLHAPRYLVECL